MLTVKNAYRCVLFLLLIICTQAPVYCTNRDIIKEHELVAKSKSKKLSYYIFTADFVKSFIQSPTSTVSPNSTTIASRSLAGRAPVYNMQDLQVGTCMASFLCIQNDATNVFTAISNYLSINNGLILSWFTPTSPVNLELDTLVNSMVTECIVTASTKIGSNPFYGKKFNMVVSASSDRSRIYFKLKQI